MTGFTIEFAYPWLLLLLIPAAVLTVLPYFFLNKRYRRTRNRIVSMVMHGLVMLFAILALSGMQFRYTVHNDENEILLLVDVSDSEETCAARRDAFVENIVEESSYDGYRIGVVKFGFDQCFSVPFTSDTEKLLEQYYATDDMPDTTATDIAGALRYAQTLLTYPETAKIVLITDGRQTDENARSVVRSIAAQGIKIDTVNIAEGFDKDNLRITNVSFPEDYHVELGGEVDVSVQLYSAVQGTAQVEVYDNGQKVIDTMQPQENEEGEEEPVGTPVVVGSQFVNFKLTFREEGIHEVVVRAAVDGDLLENNNEYCTYFNIKVYKKVLILEREEGKSETFAQVLRDENADIQYEVTVQDITTAPSSVDELCKYDQVVLNDIANADLPEGFGEILYDYVYNAGGGLFTTGGSDVDANGELVAHSYNNLDLPGTLLQQMLPVQAINYTTPIGVEILVDISGSMTTDKLAAAKGGALSILDVLSERDYVGIISLASNYETALPPTSLTQETVIEAAINNLKGGQNMTNFTDAIDRAGLALKSLKNVDKRHIIIVSDGQYNFGGDPYGVAERYYREAGITISVIGIEMGTAEEQMRRLIHCANDGTAEEIDAKMNDPVHPQLLYPIRSSDLNNGKVEAYMINDVTPTRINGAIAFEEGFNPLITGDLPHLTEDLSHEPVEGGSGVATQWLLNVRLGGFYGTRARSGAKVVLTGEYNAPLYAQWSVGKGKVGSFLCDVAGVWSKDFLASDDGKLFLRNVVGNLMPTEDIVSPGLQLSLREENYINQLTVACDEEFTDGDTLTGEILSLSEEDAQPISLDLLRGEARGDVYTTTFLTVNENNRKRAMCSFVIKTPGVYRITVRRTTASGDTVESVIYKSFAYSSEYGEWTDSDGSVSGERLLADLAEEGNGKTIDTDAAWDVFEGLTPEFERTFDPRILFMVLSIVFFLIDIVVRKFKFKWPHELIREYKERKAEEK